MSRKSILQITSWVLLVLVLVAAGGVWASQRLDGSYITAYDVFPLLGIGAFSIMWTHYVLGSLRRRLGLGKSANKLYAKVSGIAVLFLLLLHPGILNAQLYREGFGTPPSSYAEVYPEGRLAITFGTIALIIFLLFELKRKFYQKHWWRYVEWAQLGAMALIFVHGLSLGQELSMGWYRVVWFFYGLSFIFSIIYNSWYDKREKGGSDEK